MPDNQFTLIDHKSLISNMQSGANSQRYAVGDKHLFVDYLKNGGVLTATLSPVIDEVDSTQPTQLLNHWQTDGLFVWFGMLSYYVDNYDMPLPKDFTGSVQARRFQPLVYAHGFVSLERSLSDAMIHAVFEYERLHEMDL